MQDKESDDQVGQHSTAPSGAQPGGQQDASSSESNRAHRRGLELLVGLAAVVLGLVLVCLLGANILVGSRAPLPPGGISRDRAVELASPHVGGNDAHLQDAEAGPYRDVYLGAGPNYGVKPDRMVWAVTFLTTVAICPPPHFANPSDSATCWPSRTATTIVFLDYYTGDFLSTATSA